MNFAKLYKNLITISLFFATVPSTNLFAMQGTTSQKPSLSDEELNLLGKVTSHSRFRVLDVQKQIEATFMRTEAQRNLEDLKRQKAEIEAKKQREAEAIERQKLAEAARLEEIERARLERIEGEKLALRMRVKAMRKQKLESLMISPTERQLQADFEYRLGYISSRVKFFDANEEEYTKFLGNVRKYLKGLFTRQAPLIRQPDGSITQYQIFESINSSNNLKVLMNKIFRLLKRFKTIEGFAEPIGPVGPGSFEILHALVYIDRIIQIGKINITKSNIYRLFLTSLMMAIKVSYDFKIVQQKWVNIAEEELTKTDLLKLQLAFIDAINVPEETQTPDSFYANTFHVTPSELMVMIGRLGTERICD